MKRYIFLYSGEGTSDRGSSSRLPEHSQYWSEIRSILKSKFDLNLEELWKNEIGTHRCPHSPVLTVTAQICLSDIWNQWGYQPDVVIGHSIGELAASHQAGLYSLEEILAITYGIGKVAAKLEGVMLHGELSDQQIDALPVNLSSQNFSRRRNKHVTLSGYKGEMLDFAAKNPGFVVMKLPHPWHHPDYGKFSGELTLIESKEIQDSRFVSGVTGEFERRLGADHWQRWLTSPVDFIGAMQTIKNRYPNDQFEIIEIGFHPVLDKCCEIFDRRTYVSSMFRGEDEIQWILHQRRLLDQQPFQIGCAGRWKDFAPVWIIKPPWPIRVLHHLRSRSLPAFCKAIFRLWRRRIFTDIRAFSSLSTISGSAGLMNGTVR